MNHSRDETFIDKNYTILESIEVNIVKFYRENAGLYDVDALNTYEFLIKYMKAKLTKYPLPQLSLKGLSYQICQNLFLPIMETLEASNCLKDIFESLKRLEKSLK